MNQPSGTEEKKEKKVSGVVHIKQSKANKQSKLLHHEVSNTRKKTKTYSKAATVLGL
jgi:hypothetical protein